MKEQAHRGVHLSGVWGNWQTGQQQIQLQNCCCCQSYFSAKGSWWNWNRIWDHYLVGVVRSGLLGVGLLVGRGLGASRSGRVLSWASTSVPARTLTGAPPRMLQHTIWCLKNLFHDEHTGKGTRTNIYWNERNLAARNSCDISCCFNLYAKQVVNTFGTDVIFVQRLWHAFTVSLHTETHGKISTGCSGNITVQAIAENQQANCWERKKCEAGTMKTRWPGKQTTKETEQKSCVLSPFALVFFPFHRPDSHAMSNKMLPNTRTSIMAQFWLRMQQSRAGDHVH